MTEIFRRELERLSDLGHDGAAVRLIRTQLESDGLSPQRLRLAAFLGHRVARKALDSAEVPAASESAARYVEQLFELTETVAAEPCPPGKLALLVACHAACESALEYQELRDPSVAAPWREFVSGMQGWLNSPSQAGHVAVMAAMPRETCPTQTLPRALFVLLECAAAFQQLTQRGESDRQTLIQGLRLNEARCREAIAAALIPWCLRGSSATV